MVFDIGNGQLGFAQGRDDQGYGNTLKLNCFFLKTLLLGILYKN